MVKFILPLQNQIICIYNKMHFVKTKQSQNSSFPNDLTTFYSSPSSGSYLHLLYLSNGHSIE